MLRSRVTSGIDMTRLSSAVARPGIDPRIWVSIAVLTTDVFVDTKAGDQGVFANVQLLPSGLEDTARVGAIYAGNGFGLYTPLHKDDEVLVCAPSGDPDDGLVIVQRLWSTADPQPAEVVQDANDVILVVEPEKSLRITTKGAGNVVLTTEDGKVVLGDAAATRGVARLNDTTINGLIHIEAIPLPPPPATPLSTALVVTYTPPGGEAQVMTITIPLPGVTVVPADIVLSGKIDSASEKVVAS